MIRMIRYITTSIPYVNANPHIGFAMEAIEVDVYARYFRVQGDTVRAQTGTDDNSLKNVRAAREAGEDIEPFVARHAEVFRGLGAVLDVSFDDFMRTREDRHVRGAQKLWSLLRAEDLYTKTYRGLYCVGCEAFYTNEETDNGSCRVHQKQLEFVDEQNVFFRLSRYQSRLDQLIETDAIRITPVSRKHEALGFVRQGLQDISISRSVARAEHWGIPVPQDPSQVMYVWVDALSNYITALGFADDLASYQTFWQSSDVRAHVIGKDILRFHAVYWPALLLSAGLPLPTDLFVHGFLTTNGEKISKSLGNVIAPEDVVREFGVDAVRYALLRELTPGEDGDFSSALLESRYAELANALGNLVSRVVGMSKPWSGNVGLTSFESTTQDVALREHIERFDFRSYVDVVWEVVGAANEKVDRDAPFKLVKTDPDAARQSLAELAAMIRWIGSALAPIMPHASAEILRRYAGATLIGGDALFPRRDTIRS